MADNLQIVPIPSNTWVDLYAATSIAVGTVLQIENSGADDVYLTVQELKPANDAKTYNIIKRPPSVNMQNSAGDLGAWAYCSNTNGQLSISSPAKEGFLPTVSSNLNDGFGNPVSSYMGAIDVHIAEVHQQIVNELFHFHTGIESTIAVAVTAGDVSIELADATGFLINDTIQINNGQIETTFPIITDTPGGNVLVLDRPLDFNYNIGDIVEIVHTDISDDIGTLLSPVSHVSRPEPGIVWFINRIILTMTHATEATDDRFGGIAELENGFVLRANISGQFGSFTNWKTNEDIILDMYDVRYSDKAGPSLFGTSGRGSFSRIGAWIILNGNNGDFLEGLTQDDLTGLNSFFINAQGYQKFIGIP